MSLTATVISHFYNEEYLLPWWLKHHTRMFDHGILINRGSTDRSVEICRLLAPHWEVRESRTSEFDAEEADREVMEIEKEVKGWKIVLNTTEFLCCRDMRQFLLSLEFAGAQMYYINGIVMVDDPNYGYKDPDYNLPLVLQRHHGFFENDFGTRTRGRFIHKHHHGAYHAGRHSTGHHFQPCPTDAFIKWFGFSPWNDAFRKRKLQIGPTLSENSIRKGMGIYHLIDPVRLESMYMEAVKYTKDLRLHPQYQRVFENWI